MCLEKLPPHTTAVERLFTQLLAPAGMHYLCGNYVATLDLIDPVIEPTPDQPAYREVVPGVGLSATPITRYEQVIWNQCVRDCQRSIAERLKSGIDYFIETTYASHPIVRESQLSEQYS